MKRCLGFIVLLLQLPYYTAAQEDADWSYNNNVNFGCNLYLYINKGQKFPGWKAFAGLSLAAVNKHYFIINYGPTLSLYSKSLGANLNPLTEDIQIDFAHSFSLGGWWGDAPGYTKYIRTIGNSAAYNLVLQQRNAVFLSTIFVLNNHKRNQALGAITGNFGDFTINYYNDGGAPMDWLPISDHFDRYWTGGLGLSLHNNSSFNYAEFAFDQFTGYEPLLYEISSMLGIRVPDYNIKKDSGNKAVPSFNTSAYNLRIMPYRNYGVDIGVLGALQSSKGIPFGLQDIIHTIGHYALHPNNDFNRFYIGATYLSTSHELY